MTRIVSIVVASIVLSLVTCAWACSSPATPVRFSDQWPTKVGGYEDTAEHWTRRGVLRAPFSEQGSQLVELYATFLSTEWRAAYVDRQAAVQKLSTKRRQELQSEQQERAQEGYEIELLVSTYHPQHNELHRERSIWRVSLVDEAGNEILANRIEKDRRPRQVVSAEFAHFGDFAEAYRVRFPHSPGLWQGKKFSLRVSSSLGLVEVHWDAKR